MVDDCLMTQDCPGFDREADVCLVRPDDCPFSPQRSGEREEPTEADRPGSTGHGVPVNGLRGDP
jgi:hypothetical protein